MLQESISFTHNKYNGEVAGSASVDVHLSIPFVEVENSEHDNFVYLSNSYYRDREKSIRQNLRIMGFDAWGMRDVKAKQPLILIPELYCGDPYRIIRMASRMDFEGFVRFAVLEPSSQVIGKVYNYEADRHKELYYHLTNESSPYKDRIVSGFLKDTMQRYRLHSHTVIRAYLFLAHTGCLNNPTEETLDAERFRLFIRDYALTVHYSFWDMYVNPQLRERLRNLQDVDWIKSSFLERERPWTSIKELEG